MEDTVGASVTPVQVTPPSASTNNSGSGESTIVPPEIKGWSWGGFLWSWIWGVGNNVWISLLSFVPIVGMVMPIVLGIKGREWAWKNKHWDSVESFKKTQRSWAKWWLIIMLPLTVIWFVAYIALIVLVAVNPSAQIKKAEEIQLRNNSQTVQQDSQIPSDGQ